MIEEINNGKTEAKPKLVSGFTHTLTLVLFCETSLKELCLNTVSKIFKPKNKNDIKIRARPKLVCAFTLIELMIVIAIIGIFAAIAFVGYNSSLAKSRDSVRLGDLKSISLAIQNYWQESGYTKWPQSLSDPLLGKYFSGGIVPKDPQGKDYLFTPFGDDAGTNKKDFCLGAKTEATSSYACNMVNNGTAGVNYTYTVPGP